MFTEQTNESKNTPQARRLAQTRQALLQNARQMIVAQGIDGLSIRALADSINYTPGALYNYFSSKEALVDAVRADCFDELNDFIAERVGTAVTAPEMLLLGGLAYIEYAAQHPQEYHLMFNMEPSHATSGEQREITMRTLLQIVELGVAQSQITLENPYDAAAIAYHCWATVHGIASLQTTVLQDERADLPELNRLILQKVIDGLLP